MAVQERTRKGNPEVRLLMKILAIAGFIILLVLLGGYIFLRIKAPQLMHFSEGVKEMRIEVHLDSLPNARFIQGMEACENIWLHPASHAIFVTTLKGNIYYLDGGSRNDLHIVDSIHPGSSVTGICKVPGERLAAVINTHMRDEWVSIGAAVNLLSFSLDTVQPISPDYQAANGICCDGEGNLYMASNNFRFLSPEGNIYFMKRMPDGTYAKAIPLFDNVGLSNGLFYDSLQHRIYFSNTIGGVYSFVPGEKEYREEYLKTRFMEACDDLCTDVSGNLWMTDPGYSTVKVFNPGTDRLVRFVIHGIGQTSSCRIRNENGMEILYLTELKKEQKPMSQQWDGRGVLIVPANELLGLINRMQPTD